CENGLAALLVPDDGGPAHQVVAVRMVTVVVGVDQRAHGALGDGLDGVQVGAGPALGGGGVDADHAVPADQEAGVVEVPAAVRLQVGVDVRADFPELAQAHRGAPCSCVPAAGPSRPA